MTSLTDDIKKRAQDQLHRQDHNGRFLQLNYRDWQTVKGEDYGAILTAINRQLRRYKRQLYGFMIAAPLLLGMLLYMRWQMTGESFQVWAGVFDIAFVSAMSGFTLRYYFRRISALQETKTLYELLAGEDLPRPLLEHEEGRLLL